MADFAAVGYSLSTTFDLFERGERVFFSVPDMLFQMPDREQEDLIPIFGNVMPDVDAPTFAGINALIALGARSVRATWLAGNDVITDAGDLRYEVHLAKSAGASFTTRAVVVGGTQADFDDLLPETTYYARVRCMDEAGNVDSNVAEQSVTTPSDVAGRPTIGSFSPSSGATIVSNQAISFEVTDDSGEFRRIMVIAKFANGSQEVVHNGVSFSPFYASSTRSVIAGGFAYTLTRSGGWVAGAAQFEVIAIDKLGNEN